MGHPDNQYEVPTDKLQKPRPLYLTEGLDLPIFSDIGRSGDKTETECHAPLQEHRAFSGPALFLLSVVNCLNWSPSSDNSPPFRAIETQQRAIVITARDHHEHIRITVLQQREWPDFYWMSPVVPRRPRIIHFLGSRHSRHDCLTGILCIAI